MEPLDDLSWRDVKWIAADGRQVALKDMSLGHLVNVLNWVHDLTDRYSQSIKEALLREADYRKFLGFSGNTLYPEQVNGKWVIFNPKTGDTCLASPPKQYLNKAKKNKSYVELKKQVNKIRSQKK